jgi:hypothetical protein
MSDDLVKRLRSCANGAWLFKTKQGDFGICDDAADRIEALIAERDVLIQDRDRWAEEAQASTSPIVAGLTADNARLRAELTKAADSLDWADAHLEDAGVVSANVRYGARDARAALTGKETK